MFVNRLTSIESKVDTAINLLNCLVTRDSGRINERKDESEVVTFLPLKNMEEFKNFEAKLKDVTFKNDFVIICKISFYSYSFSLSKKLFTFTENHVAAFIVPSTEEIHKEHAYQMPNQTVSEAVCGRLQ